MIPCMGHEDDTLDSRSPSRGERVVP